MAELADALDLGSSGQPCRFNSCYPHQKKFTVDFLTKKQKVTEGKVSQYYVRDTHEVIIPPEIFDLAQYEYQKRTAKLTNIQRFRDILDRQANLITEFDAELLCATVTEVKVFAGRLDLSGAEIRTAHDGITSEQLRTLHLFYVFLREAFHIGVTADR